MSLAEKLVQQRRLAEMSAGVNVRQRLAARLRVLSPDGADVSIRLILNGQCQYRWFLVNDLRMDLPCLERNDYSGKDFKKLALKDAKACEEACRGESLCLGFTFIGGYDTCWLKKTKGKLSPKIFHCIVLATAK